MKALFTAGALMGVLLTNSTAEAATYLLNRSINGGTAIGTITTDGTVGVLGNDNITDFSIAVTLLGFSRTVIKAGGGYSTVGNGLSATGSGLSFDFAANDGSYVYFSSGGSFMPTFYCLQANGPCIDNNGPGEGLLTYNVSTRTPRSGIVEFASLAGAVPEAATWAMFMTGLGFVGGVSRRRKRATQAVFA